ncbi:MAG: protein kinase family protein [Leptolyngbyaceae cyanobacterium SU_3_3]|nr:protein kinase family protein [Leptolyngbyaceae cyanobacterium SU_3_3]
MVKLNELFEVGVSRYREILNFIQRPGDILTQKGRQAAQERFNEIELPLGQQSSQKTSKPPSDNVQGVDLQSAERQPISAPSSRTMVADSNQVRSQVSAIRSTPKPLHSPNVPLLPDDKDLRGRRGKYRREGAVVQVTDQSRLYQGKLVFNQKPVLIKEYLLLERYFNPTEARQVKDRFANLANLNLKAGVGQDFRVVAPWDVIAPPHSSDRCCYLITEPILNSLTLKEYLTKRTMSAKQVRSFLSQVLQTLWFLHHQRVRLSSSELRPGIAHGNLNLDSLLIVSNSAVADEPDF